MSLASISQCPVKPSSNETRADTDHSRAARPVLPTPIASTLMGGQASAQTTSVPSYASQDAIEAIGQPSARYVAYAQ